jgi:hypothetical protein
MSSRDHYADFKWIKVKRYSHDPNLSWEESYRKLDEHHQQETSFLIEEVRKLAAIVDERDEEIRRLKEQNP